MPLSLKDIETRFGITLPQRLRGALLNPSDPIHKRALLFPAEGNSCESIFAVNDDLRKLEWKLWPDYLVAFATSECGDYFALDSRSFPYKIYYIDPIDTVPESLERNEQDGFVFESFDAWYEYETQG